MANLLGGTRIFGTATIDSTLSVANTTIISANGVNNINLSNDTITLSNSNAALTIANTLLLNSFVKTPYPVVAPIIIKNKGIGQLVNTSTITSGGSGPNYGVVDPTGTYLFVPNSSSSNMYVYKINQANGTLTVAASQGTGSAPNRLTITPDGRFVYVVNFTSASISMFSISSAGYPASIASGSIATSASPYGVMADRTGRFLYATNNDTNTITNFSINQTTGNLTNIATTFVGAATNPQEMIVDPTGRFLYVNNFGAATIGIWGINQSSGNLTNLGTATAAGFPTGLAIDPSGKYLYCVTSASASVIQYNINQANGSLTSIATTGSFSSSPQYIAIDPAGRNAYVTSSSSKSMNMCTINQANGALQLLTADTGSNYIITGDNPVVPVIDPSGRFLYTINSGGSGTITHFSIFSDSGTLHSMPAFSAYASSVTSIVGATYTKVAFQVKEFDTTNSFDNTTNYRYQPPIAGWYQVNASLAYSAATSEGYIVIRKNGTGIKAGADIGGSCYSTVLSAMVYLSGTDYIEIFGYASSTLNNSASQTGTFFQAFFVRP
jgi:hypothetical protein